MSASHLRYQFRIWANETAAPQPHGAGVQYYDTINLQQKPVDSTWWTAEFMAEYFEGTFCKPGYIEVGAIRVIVLSKPGIGDNAAIAAIEAIIPRLMERIDPTQRVTLLTHEPIQEASAGDADRHYRVSAIINYRLSL